MCKLARFGISFSINLKASIQVNTESADVLVRKRDVSRARFVRFAHCGRDVRAPSINLRNSLLGATKEYPVIDTSGTLREILVTLSQTGSCSLESDALDAAQNTFRPVK